MGTSNPTQLRHIAQQRELLSVVAQIKADTEVIRQVIDPAAEVPEPEYSI